MYNYYILITQQMLQTFWPNTSAYVPFVSVTENKATYQTFKNLSILHSNLAHWKCRSPFWPAPELVTNAVGWRGEFLEHFHKTKGFGFVIWIHFYSMSFIYLCLTLSTAYLYCFKQKKIRMTSWFFVIVVWSLLVLITFCTNLWNIVHTNKV